MSFIASFFHRQLIYTPPIPTASFEGKTAIVTGSNVGLGKEASRWLVRLGAARVIIACRDVEKGQAAAKDIQASTSCSPDLLQVWPLDMSSYASVQAFADRVEAELTRLDVLIANAGLRADTFQITEQDEESITTNVISLFLHAFLLFPKLHKTAVEYNTQTYFTVTASELYEVAKFTESKVPAGQIFATLSDQTKANMGDRYNVSKLLEIFIVKQVAVIAPLSSGKVIVNCVAPGFCDTELTRGHDSFALRLFKKLFSRTAEVGSRTLVHGASAGADSHGQYVPDCKITPTVGLTCGEAGAELQKGIWAELKEKLERVRPGVTSLI